MSSKMLRTLLKESFKNCLLSWQYNGPLCYSGEDSRCFKIRFSRVVTRINWLNKTALALFPFQRLLRSFTINWFTKLDLRRIFWADLPSLQLEFWGFPSGFPWRLGILQANSYGLDKEFGYQIISAESLLRVFSNSPIQNGFSSLP